MNKRVKRKIQWPILVIAAGFSFITLMFAAASDPSLPIVPYPQQLVKGSGEYAPKGPDIQVRLSGLEGEGVEIIKEQLSAAFESRFQIQLEFGEKGNPDIWIGLPLSDPELKNVADSKGLVPDAKLGDEGYILKVEKREIYILANKQAGAFYGLQSLRQLFRGLPDPQAIPALTIVDWPSLAFRCVMDDISRGPIPTAEYMKLQVRRYAEMKINAMSFYIEHVVRTEKYPDFAPANGAISVQEFKELSEYAADYHVKLMGNFQSLGHFEQILKHPQYRQLGATERMLDPLNPDAISFLRDVYREMTPAFSSEFFTPNLDEAWDLSRGGLTGAAAGMGVARIYADHVTRIDSTLRKLGKRTVVWGDIIKEHPEILDMIPKDIVLGAWAYGASESFASFIDPLKNGGFDFTVSPGVLNSNRLIPDFNMSTTNIRNFINEGYEKGALGVYCTVWDDGGIHFFSHDWYGVAYNAEQCWRPNRDPLEDFDVRFSRGIYGDQKNLIPRALHALNHLTDLGPTFEMNSNVFYKALIPERGSKTTFNLSEWKEVKRWLSETRNILSGQFTPVYDLDLAFIKFTLSQYEFMANSREELIEAAVEYQQACELQRSDRAASMKHLEQTRTILEQLKFSFEKLMADFDILWDMESRPYWKDKALMAFEKHQHAFGDQIRLLERAVAVFKTGEYLPPPSEVRIDIRQHSGQYFQYWLLTGSFHIDTFEHSSTDFLTSIGGESEARPFPGMLFTGPAGEERMWVKYDSPLQGELDFLTVFEPHITCVAYAYCTIETKEKGRVTALLGSNDGATVYCNGEQVHHIHTKRSLIRDEDEIILDLEEGRNHILIKVEQWKAGWGLSFRLKDVDVRNHKQKYYIQ